MGTKRIDSDEYYVLDLCDELLEEKGIRQYNQFPFLCGDTGRRLSVDIFYPQKSLVIEYREKQHYEDVPFFDKPQKMTASGVPRKVQRIIYDKRREEILPKHGIDIIIIPYFDLSTEKNGKLKRDREEDMCSIKTLLGKYQQKKNNEIQ